MVSNAVERSRILRIPRRIKRLLMVWLSQCLRATAVYVGVNQVMSWSSAQPVKVRMQKVVLSGGAYRAFKSLLVKFFTQWRRGTSRLSPGIFAEPPHALDTATHVKLVQQISYVCYGREPDAESACIA